jgi:hypothetical protein
MLSADIQEEQSPILNGSDYDGYLIKPVANAHLLSTIAKHLNLRWIYQKKTQSIDTQKSASRPSEITYEVATVAIINMSDHPLIVELKNCAQLGFQRGARNVLSEITRQNILPQATNEALQTLCQQFQFEKLISLLESLSNDQ